MELDWGEIKIPGYGCRLFSTTRVSLIENVRGSHCLSTDSSLRSIEWLRKGSKYKIILPRPLETLFSWASYKFCLSVCLSVSQKHCKSLTSLFSLASLQVFPTCRNLPTLQLSQRFPCTTYRLCVLLNKHPLPTPANAPISYQVVCTRSNSILEKNQFSSHSLFPSPTLRASWNTAPIYWMDGPAMTYQSGWEKSITLQPYIKWFSSQVHKPRQAAPSGSGTVNSLLG